MNLPSSGPASTALTVDARLRYVTILIAMSLAAPQLHAASVLDQQHFGGSGFASNGGGVAAQTFTVGLTGMLDRIEATIRPSEPAILPGGKLTIEMRLLRVVAGVPSSNPTDVLAFSAIEIPNSSFELYPSPFGNNPFQWAALDAIGLSVHAGEQYAIAIGPLTDPSAAFDRNRAFDWNASFEDALPREYTAGAIWAFDALSPNFKPYGGPVRDFIFRTFVSPIPEPASAASMLMGGVFTAIAGCIRRRRQWNRA